MPEDSEYFANKRPDKTYVSKAFDPLLPSDNAKGRKMRILSKVFDPSELHQFVSIKDDVVLRLTPGERQEVKITFYEDPREIESLTIQRYTRKSGKPWKLSFTFRGKEIDRLYDLIRFVKRIRLQREGKETLDDHILDDLLFSLDEKRRYFLQHPDLVADIAANSITQSDIIALGYRRQQLGLFERLLGDADFFEATRVEWGKAGNEAVWQKFFEDNPWIFGYGLSYVFTSNLDNRRLEQITTGSSVEESGKRVDALMRTRGLISSLCFVEIKTHRTPLLRGSESYRTECWPISSELAGSISQIQKTVQKAMKPIQTRWESHTAGGDPTGEIAFLYLPKACVIIGTLGEFLTDQGINEQKFSSFELFRRNTVNPEIITFDELFERAKFIVKHSEEERSLADEVAENAEEEYGACEEIIPF